jgi:hypothetical protein
MLWCRRQRQRRLSPPHTITLQAKLKAVAAFVFLSLVTGH